VVEENAKHAGSLHNDGTVVLRGVFGGSRSGDGTMTLEGRGHIKLPRLKDGMSIYEW
jgi:hypothetical protein